MRERSFESRKFRVRTAKHVLTLSLTFVLSMVMLSAAGAFGNTSVSLAAASELSDSLPIASPLSQVVERTAAMMDATVNGKIEKIFIEFDKNAEGAAGKMDIQEMGLDNEEHELSANGYTFELHEFSGWSTTKDGKDVVDNPETKDIDEFSKASFVPDKAKLNNLGYSYVVEHEGKEPETVNANLEYAVHDGKLILYAQWREVQAQLAPAGEESAPSSDQTSSVMPSANGNTVEKHSDEGLESSAELEAPDVLEPSGDGIVDDEADADYVEENGMLGVSVEGPAAVDESLAIETIEKQDVAPQQAEFAAKTLFAAAPSRSSAKAGGASSLPTNADGNSVTQMTAQWITEDTVDNGNPQLLYRKPRSNASQEVRLRIAYALSGEKDYNPGDIVITMPLSMFTTRDGASTGKITVPYPEDPDTDGNFNWRQAGDKIVLTSTKRMKAATHGFFDIAFQDLRPATLQDMETHVWTGATIEVTTSSGAVIGLASNTLSCQMDTEARVYSAVKGRTGTVTIVSASTVPQSARVVGETEYVCVNWYMYAFLDSTQPHTLSYIDTVTDSYTASIEQHDNGNNKVKSETLYTDEQHDGKSRYSRVSVYYPLSQFQPETDYTFENQVVYTLTEMDPAVGNDPQAVTTQTARTSAIWTYHLPQFVVPSGHFKVWKCGNDGDKWTGVLGAEHSNWESHNRSWPPRLDMATDMNTDWFGIYPSALNQLRRGTDIEIGYSVETVGYILPWTLAEGADSRVASNYNQRSVTMTTTDDGLDNLTVGTDYVYTGVDFGINPKISRLQAVNVNPDGSFQAISAGDGTFKYQTDSNTSNIPQLTLQIQRNNENWQDYATVDYTSGACSITLSGGTHISGTKVNFPSDVTAMRVSATTNIAALIFYFRPLIKLKASSSKVQAFVDYAFADNRVPTHVQYNSATMTAERADTGSPIVMDTARGYDQLMGYTTDVTVLPLKSALQGLEDINWNDGYVTVHYAAQVEEQTTVSDLGSYKQALEEGEILPETSGVWYDLLPKGMIPDLSTIRLRENDAIQRVYTIEDYKNTGRTLLVVEAILVNTPTQYTANHVDYWEDVITIRFDATYSLENVINYGDALHNVIAFESGNPSLGTVENHRGEPDNPDANQNIATQRAFADAFEQATMTDLDPSSNGPRFVYAGAWTNLDLLGRGNTSLSKDVDVNNEGVFTTGVYHGHSEDYPDGEARTVYEGGQYTYRLTMISNIGTTSKNMILYDSLENFEPGSGNDSIDIGAAHWQGSLRKVDVSQLTALGIAPVVYYCTEAGLALEDANENEINSLQTNPSKWIRADSYAGSLDNVKAIAVDLRKNENGADFELAEGKAVTVLIQMQAPSGSAVDGYIASNAHAYNNAFLKSTSVDNGTLMADTKWIRKDYTKVGLRVLNINVTKTWQDDFDRDGLRPSSVTLKLMGDGVYTGKSATLTEEGGWKGAFEHIAYTNANGKKIIYSIEEEDASGYTQSVMFVGNEVAVNNIHLPEKIRIAGHKTWLGDDAVTNARPPAIRVSLYANGSSVASTTVYPDTSGDWQYDFGERYKYANHGQEIVYTVKETQTNELEKYIPTYDGTNVINTYHPYGDLRVSKFVSGATDIVKDKRFQFTFEFQTPDGEPLFDEFSYETSDGRSGTVSTEDTLELGKNESVTIYEVPVDTVYTVNESEVSGFITVKPSNASGTIRANNTTYVSFSNTYVTEGLLQVVLNKSLTGRQMTRYQFRFELYDVTGLSGEDRETGGELVRATSNAADGTVTFGVVRYGNADDGKRYTYRIQEFDRGRAGYTYDHHVAYVDVTVDDNGDGTMTVVPIYTGSLDFSNAYNAHASLSLKAWKQLSGRTLQPGEFSFEMDELDEDGDVAENNRFHQVATNNADGEILWDTLEFDQDDAGQDVFLRIRELSGNDPTVRYDSTEKVYKVTVSDNGDGTLNLVTSNVKIDPYEAGQLSNVGMEDAWQQGFIAIPTWDTTPLIVFYKNEWGYQDNVSLGLPADDPVGFDYAEDVASTSAQNVYGVDFTGLTLTADGRDRFLEWGEDKYGEKWQLDSGQIDSPLTVVYADSQIGSYVIPYAYESAQSLETQSPSRAFYLGSVSPYIEVDSVPVFYNELQDGSLRIGKRITQDSIGYDPDQTFKFRVEFGEPGAKTETRYSHTGNMGDDGVATGTVSMENDSGRTDTVTIPGAEQLTIEVWFSSYSTNYGWLAIYGADQIPTSSNYADAAVSQGKLGGNHTPADSTGRPMNPDNHKIYTLDGDTVKFYFCCGPPGNPMASSGYGYYAVVTATIPTGGSVDVDTSNVTFGQLPAASITPKGLIDGMTQLGAFLFPYPEQAQAETGDIAAGVYDGVDWKITSDGDLVLGKNGERQGFEERNRTSAEDYPWYQYHSQISAIRFDGTVACASQMPYMFYDTAAVSANLTNLDASAAMDLSYMFAAAPESTTGTAGQQMTTSGSNRLKNIIGLNSLDTGNLVNMQCMFYNCDFLLSVDLSGMDLRNVTNMQGLFQACRSLRSVDFSGAQTQNLLITRFMFYDCSELVSVDLSDFDTSNVTDMTSMFGRCSSLPSLDLSSFDTSSVTSMSSMFQYCDSLTFLDISSFNASNVTDMTYMFSSCSNLASLDLSNFNAVSLTRMQGAFSGCHALTSLDLSSFDTSNVTQIANLFAGCSSLQSLDLSSFNMENVSDASRMFYGCGSLSYLDLSGISFPSVTQTYNFNDKYTSCDNLNRIKIGPTNPFIGASSSVGDISLTGIWIREDGAFGPYDQQALCETDFHGKEGIYIKQVDTSPTPSPSIVHSGIFDGVAWRITSEGELIIGQQGETQRFTYRAPSSSNRRWPWCYDNLQSLVKSVRFEGNVQGNGDMSHMFMQTALSHIDFTNFDASDVTTIADMFSRCVSLETVEWANLNTSNVRSMYALFYACQTLNTMDFSGLDTSRVMNMEMMFSGCSSMTALDLSALDTSNVTTMSQMFYGCQNLRELDLSSFNTANVTDMGGMFSMCTSLESLDLSNFDTSSLTNTRSLVNSYGGYVSDGMFQFCVSLETLDLSGWDVSHVGDFAAMFTKCYKLSQLDLSSFATSSTANMTAMFSDSGLEILVLGADWRFGANAEDSGLGYGSWYQLEGYWDKPITLAEMISIQDASIEGTWVWAGKQHETVVTYDTNGGFLSGSASDASFENAPSFILPEPTRPGYIFAGWTVESDGGGELMPAGFAYHPAYATRATLYAQWAKDTYVGFTVRNYVKNLDDAGYSLVDTISYNCKGEPGDEIEVNPRFKKGFALPASQTVTLAGDGSSIVDFYYERAHYTIRFEPNGAEFGYIEPLEMTGGVAANLPANAFSYSDHAFLGWTTMPGSSDWQYVDKQQVIDLGDDGEIVVLYAKWSEALEAPTSTNGKYTVKLKGEKTLELVGLPYGTEYEITEVNVPDGWTQVGRVGESGAIEVNTTQEVEFTNEYSASGECVINMRKTFEGGMLEEGEFVFELLNSAGDVIDRASNGAPDDKGIAAIEFAPIQYSQEGVFRYTAREIAGSDERIVYDQSEIGITVLVADAGDGNLDTLVEFDGDDDMFVNEIGTGSLTLSKLCEGITDVVAGQEFVFDVTLESPDGQPWIGRLTSEDVDAVDGTTPTTTSSSIFKTSNIDDNGIKLVDYTSSESYFGVVSLPGAEELSLSYNYSVPRGNFVFWLGDVSGDLENRMWPAAAAYMSVYYDSSSENLLLHDEIVLPGDTVTILYQSYAYPASSAVPANGGYGQYTNYGLYLVASSSIEDDSYEILDVADGEFAVTLAGGESATIDGIPNGVTYTIEERELENGWVQTSATETAGTMVVNGHLAATATNSYFTSGFWTPHAQKILGGASLESGQYEFELVDKNGELVSSGRNDEAGNVTMSPVLYTGRDHNEEYWYTLREVVGKEGNTVYDSRTVDVVVRPVDNGDGTMTIQASYDGGTTFEGEVGAAQAVFENTRDRSVKSVAVTKTWKQGLYETPWPDGVTVYAVLYADGQEVSRAALTSDSVSAHFNGLQVANAGEPIEYTVQEELSVEVECSRRATLLSTTGNMDTWLLTNELPVPVLLPLAGAEAMPWVLFTLIGSMISAYALWSMRRRVQGDEEAMR